jgi:hypothetical protein
MLQHVCNHKLTLLNNGKKVRIGFQKKQDRDDLVRFFRQTSPGETQCPTGEDDKAAEVPEYCWSQENSNGGVTLAGQDVTAKLPAAFLHLYRRPQNAPDEISQVLLVIPFQGQGSNSRLLDDLIALASQEQLCWLKLKVMAELEPVIQTFEDKKFEVRAIFKDYLTDANGKRHDVALMMRPI